VGRTQAGPQTRDDRHHKSLIVLFIFVAAAEHFSAPLFSTGLR
jgi:hypothetical protein